MWKESNTFYIKKSLKENDDERNLSREQKFKLL